MEQLEIYHLDGFLKQMALAIEDHLAFAAFVRDSEVFCKNESVGLVDENLIQYRKIWFDLEIINALSLDEWESEGKPDNWFLPWRIKYKKDAEEVISELRTLLNDEDKILSK